MRYDNLRAFAKHIQSSAPNHFQPLYLLISKNSHDISEASKILINLVFPEGKYNEMEVKTFDGESFESHKFVEEINTLSLFVKKRIVFLHHVDKLTTQQLTLLDRELDRIPDKVLLVLTAESIHKGSKHFKKVEKLGTILDIPEEKSWQKEKNIQVWLREKIYKDGKQIEPQGVDLLIKQIGVDQHLLDQEIFKLYCYLGNRTLITVDDICQICSVSSTHSIWELGEAIFASAPLRALKFVKSLLKEGASLIGLIRQLRTQFQTHFQIATILSKNQSREEITRHFPYLKGSLLNKKIYEVESYGKERLKRGILTIDEFELKAKNSNESVESLAELLIVHLSTKS